MEDTLTNDQAADKVRAFRLFSNLASAALGIEPDQNYANEDAYIGSPFGVHASADPYRGAVVQGRTNRFDTGSTSGAGALVITPGLILLGLGAWFLFKKG